MCCLCLCEAKRQTFLAKRQTFLAKRQTFVAKHTTGLWCFIPPPTTGGQPGAYVDSQGRTRAIPPPTPTRENTRCAFFVSIN